MKRIVAGMTALLAVGTGAVFAVVGGGDVSFAVKGAAPAVFSHTTHVEGMGLKCQACHPKLYIDSKQHKKVTMKAMQKGKSCGACHDGKKAFSVKGDCAKCHRK